VLALAMFDKLAIDFSQLQSRFGAGSSGGGGGQVVVALTMGAVAALLAGACVAPVVISVLLLATNLYSHGNWLGLTLPFFLGLGMALPWPVAGAGVAFLPKPGVWMVRVKYGFGVIIAVLAVYYGHTAYSLMPSLRVTAKGSGLSSGAEISVEDSTRELLSALKQSQADGKPLVIDFWASWCKNCSAMEHTTFKDETVRTRMSLFRTVKFQAERPGDPSTKAILDYFGAMGLPTYIVLKPAGEQADRLKPDPGAGANVL
jgi:thiol:disulfide interchange protein DsbD